MQIDANGRKVPLNPDPWQEEDFAAMDAAWLEIGGYEVRASVRRAWHERPRGHSKTSDIAISIAWALAYAIRPIRGLAAASSREQASILRDFIATLCRLNPDLDEALEINNFRVTNRKTKSSLEIISSEVSSSWGELVDFVVCDEVSHWPDGRGEQLWQSLFSTAAKRERCLIVVITNAGFTESWAWKVRESIRRDPDWRFSRLDGPKASWLTSRQLEEQRRMLPNLVYERLWGNIWSVGAGDAIHESDIAAAVVLEKPQGHESGWQYFGGVDLSVSRDPSSLVIIGKNNSGRLRLAVVQRWQPRAGEKIDLEHVKDVILALDRVYRPHWLIDPYQAELLNQQLQRAGLSTDTVYFSGQNLVEMASAMVEAFSSRVIELYNEPVLLSDLRKLRIKESPAGWRLDAPRTAQGHCDTAVALSLAILAARRAGVWVEGEYLTGEAESAFYKMDRDVIGNDAFGEFVPNWGD